MYRLRSICRIINVGTILWNPFSALPRGQSVRCSSPAGYIPAAERWLSSLGVAAPSRVHGKICLARALSADGKTLVIT
jgi:hypothetical protein